ncbi:MAG: PDZ domain-containing protein [Phycisphaeraceae bacterium]|nr:PDZ domain-containing protein [Phycisphaeraceae bacterium]
MGYMIRWALLCILMVGLFLAPTTPGLADDRQAAPLISTDELTRLADAGEFDRLLTSLRTTPEDATVDSLIKDIERFQTSRAEQANKQRKAYNDAYQKMVRQADAGQLEEAVFTALLARDLAGDLKPVFLKDEKVTEILKRTEAAAKESEAKGDWVEALSLYRSLDELFDDYATYHKQLKLAANHLRVLRAYAPDELERLLRERSERLKKNREAEEAAQKALDAKNATPEEIKDKQNKQNTDSNKDDEIRPLDKEPWEKKLASVELPMLKQTIGNAGKKHVSSRGYAQLLKGSAQAMITLVDTKAIAVTFPAMKDEVKVAQFRQRFSDVITEIDNATGYSYLDALGLIDRMVGINSETLNLPEEVIVYEMTEGAMDTLDEFSFVIWPYRRESFARTLQGKFYGVGIQIASKFDHKTKRDRLIVISPLADTPAYRAGILPNDIIAEVNGEATTDWSIDQAVRTITGEEGTIVTLGIQRGEEPALRQFKLVRAEIPIESIRGWQHKQDGSWDYYIDRDQKIGYVRLSEFIPQSAGDLDAAVKQMEKDAGINALILDLRFNPGGLLSSAVEIVNRFVPEGTIVSTVGPADTRSSVFEARPERAWKRRIPVVVLINGGSASASEIVSGALQDYHRALIVGTRSFGKGSVQDVFKIDNDKAYLRLTTQYYKLPQGRIIHRKPEDRTWGVEPDLKVEITADEVAKAIEFRQKVDVLPGNAPPPAAGAAADANKEPAPKAADILEKGVDPQLSAGLLVLKTRLVARHIALAQNAAK